MDKISEAILKYRCCICNNPLSVPPIMMTNASEELYKCGRCKDIIYRSTAQQVHFQQSWPTHQNFNRSKIQNMCRANLNETSFYRATLYEGVAQHLSFPCRYNQCNEKIVWGKIETHERDCPHRTICCPLFDSGCSKMLKMNELVQHFKITHSTCIKEVGTAIQVRNQTNNMFLLTLKDSYFIVYILSGGRIGVLSTQSSGYAKFNVRLTLIEDNNFSVNFGNLPIISFKERSHCYMCVKKTCNQPHHPFSGQNRRQSEMNLDSFTTRLEKSCFNCLLTGSERTLRFFITPVSNDNEEAQNNVDQVVLQPQAHEGHLQALKKALTCPCCVMYMATTIYICAVGHSFCAQCKMRLQNCPLCRRPIGDSRNFILEELAASVDLPCMYHNRGCTFVAKTPDVRDHEETCCFSVGLVNLLGVPINL